MKPSENQEILNYLDSLSDFQKELILEIRELVLSANDKVKEGIKWGSIAFYNKKNICGFRVAKSHVTLLFMEGASLNDGHKILSGSGAKARTLKVTNLEEIAARGAGIKDLIQQAIQLGM